MNVLSAKGIYEEAKMDFQISKAKMVWCIKRFRETNDTEWLHHAERIGKESNAYYAELNRCLDSVSDPDEYFFLRRNGSRNGNGVVV